MQNFGAQNEDGNEEGAAQMSAANGSINRSQVGRRIVETSKSELVSHAQEES